MEPKGTMPPDEGTGMPSMMRQMMEKMGGGGEFNPAVMCQAMMTSVGKSAEFAASPRPRSARPLSVTHPCGRILRSGCVHDLAGLMREDTSSGRSRPRSTGPRRRNAKVELAGLRRNRRSGSAGSPHR